MKLKYSYVFIFLCSLSINCSTQKLAKVNIVQQTTGTSSFFKHPGILNSREQLSFIKKKLKNGEEPWKTAFKQLRESPFSSSNYQPKPYDVVDCGSYNKPNVGCDQQAQDGMAVYCNALMYCFTNDENYAKKALSIIDAWANTYQKNTSSNARLLVSWTAPWIANGAELLKYEYPGWKKENENQVNKLFDKFLPYVMDETMPGNNWVQSAIEANFAIAVFKDDKPLFDKAVERWKTRVRTYIYESTDGDKPINTPGKSEKETENTWKQTTSGTVYINGLAMESCRDLGHLNLGFNSMMYSAETAFQQNIDLFSLEQKRLTDFMELHGSWMTGAVKVPANICDGFIVAKRGDKDGITPPMGGGESAWEIAYSHLHDRLKIFLPYTKKMIEDKRPAHISKWVSKGETLTHAGIIF
ncbi:MAG: alginate lyase family protein [Chitinophagaceae bacterium]